MRCSFIGILAWLLAGVAPASHAATFGLEVGGNLDFGASNPTVLSSSSPVSLTGYLASSGGMGTNTISALAGPGLLGVDSVTTLNFVFLTLWVGSITTVSFEDTVVFTGPDASVITSLNFALDGSVSDDDQESVRTVGPLLSIELYTLNYQSGFSMTQAGQPTGLSGLYLSVPDPLDVDGVFSTPNVTVPTNTPVLLRVRFTAANGQRGIGSGNTVVDYLDTFTLASGGPVFNLPAGFTANAPDLGIVDNAYQVPEPAVAWLLASAAGVLGYGRRRRG